jgi:hypothetical protein
METIQRRQVIEKDGEVRVTGVPCKKGQQVELILFIEPLTKAKRFPLTARRLLDSGLIGLWKDRKDLSESAVYAHQLREQAQKRQR